MGSNRDQGSRIDEIRVGFHLKRDKLMGFWMKLRFHMVWYPGLVFFVGSNEPWVEDSRLDVDTSHSARYSSCYLTLESLLVHVWCSTLMFGSRLVLIVARWSLTETLWSRCNIIFGSVESRMGPLVRLVWPLASLVTDLYLSLLFGVETQEGVWDSFGWLVWAFPRPRWSLVESSLTRNFSRDPSGSLGSGVGLVNRPGH